MKIKKTVTFVLTTSENLEQMHRNQWVSTLISGTMFTSVWNLIQKQKQKKSAYYGSCTDKFGVQWMVNSTAK